MEHRARGGQETGNEHEASRGKRQGEEKSLYDVVMGRTQENGTESDSEVLSQPSEQD